ncbi:MAG: imidazole glycerol phosphate synthase subunit HisH [Zetaproteobacteria bacterium]|nr:MAG: imidazole glycerol phosphate synthase subunit HisH [Zetaproteobacteria bacterium]
MIGLINYGMGNMHSIAKALECAGGRVRWISRPEHIDASIERIVLPGVGAFRDCMKALKQQQLQDPLLEHVHAGRPFLGICLGMQALMETSHEFGLHQGLGLIEGDVLPFPAQLPEQGYKIPHMGWNDVLLPDAPHPVLQPLVGRQVYYVHSFFCQPRHDQEVLGECEYGGIRFASAIGRDNIIGVQFHPEKSQRAGLAMLASFIGWCP